MSGGKSVRLFLADGTPGGLLTAEIMNWTGHVVAAPRSDLAALLKRPETSRTGIYILLGDDPDSVGGVMAYVGKGDDVGKRLYQHARAEDLGGKDFWERAVVLTSKDANLTKAHARYLESRLIALAGQASRAKLTNGTAPLPVLLPEADVSDMEYFIEQALIMLPVLGINIFRSAAARGPRIVTQTGTARIVQAGGSPVFELRHRKDGIVASAQEIDGEFTVLAGSQAQPRWTGIEHGYKGLREALERDGTLMPEGTGMRFVHDQVFASPSAAAAVVLGRSANGRIDWKAKGSGLSYGAWQTQGIEQLGAAEEVTA